MLVIKQDEPGYDQAVDNAANVFQSLVEAYLLGRITLEVLRLRFRRALEAHYVQLMVLGLEGREPTDPDAEELNRRLAAEFILLDSFIGELEAGTISPKRALWRAGMYAPSRGTFIYYTLPPDIAEAIYNILPGLPGDICLGNGLCGCYLDISIDIDGTVYVYWVVNPEKEHCEVCLEMASRSPFIFSRGV